MTEDKTEGRLETHSPHWYPTPHHVRGRQQNSNPQRVPVRMNEHTPHPIMSEDVSKTSYIQRVPVGMNEHTLHSINLLSEPHPWQQKNQSPGTKTKPLIGIFLYYITGYYF